MYIGKYHHTKNYTNIDKHLDSHVVHNILHISLSCDIVFIAFVFVCK